MLETRIIQGREIGPREVQEINDLIHTHPQWSRWRLSRVLAERWNWYSLSGALKDMAARTLLLKLQQKGLIELPERRHPPARRVGGFQEDLLDALLPEPVETTLKALLPLHVEVLGPKHPRFRQFERYLSAHHYLGYSGPVGENLAYLVQSRHRVDLACLLFGAAAWKAAARDQWIGWSDAQRAKGLSGIANNGRYLILPWVKVPFLASHILACVASRIDADWQARYGHPVFLLETFVEVGRFAGTCYRAANWVHVGETTGRTRQDRHNQIQAPIKSIYLYPLSAHARDRLTQ